MPDALFLHSLASAAASRCCPLLVRYVGSSPCICFLIMLYLPSAPLLTLTSHTRFSTSRRAQLDATHSRKYRPQLEAPPTRFGTRPRYNPFHPSAWTASARALYTPVPSLGFVRIDVEPVAGKEDKVALDEEAVLGPAE